MEIIVHRILL